MTREETERAIAERLAAAYGKPDRADGNEVGAQGWNGVAREVEAMIGRVLIQHWKSTAEMVRAVHDSNHPACHCPFKMPGIDLSPVLEDTE